MSHVVGQMRATIFRRFWVPYRPALLGLIHDLVNRCRHGWHTISDMPDPGVVECLQSLVDCTGGHIL